MKRHALTKKLIVLGVDGMDPRLTKKYLEEGKMPNVQKYLSRGVSSKNLVMLGAQPTITPPMWTTLATGAYPYTHGITCFGRQSKDQLDKVEYNLVSTNCKAEQIWNVTSEAGLKTLVWHWPGSSWPPSSSSENLMVIDGTQPAGVNSSVARVDKELILVADESIEEVVFRKKASSDGKIPCVIEDLKVDESKYDVGKTVNAKEFVNIMITESDGEGAISDTPFDVALSPIKEPKNWKISLPSNAKEFTLILSSGLLHRPCLIIKNTSTNQYDKVIIYKSKKDSTPIVELNRDQFTGDIIDEAIENEKKYVVNRNMRLLELNDDGSHLKLWISSALDIKNDVLWHPKRLHSEVTTNVGYPKPTCLLGGADKDLIKKCMGANWAYTGKWTSEAIHYLIDNENLDVVFSHFHNIDLQSHMIAKYLKKGHNSLSAQDYQMCLEDVYRQTDDYLGQYLDLLDKGWTVMVVSDHGIVCPEYDPPLLCDPSGVNAGLMSELGFTVLKKDKNGNPIKEIDWEKTKAVQTRGNHIYLNLKGRDEKGIIEPEDKFNVEEEIMTALYGYRDPKTGHRVVALALRNKDAYLLGMGGPECGDILLWTAEGYNHDHGDSLSTTYGHAFTSTSPIFFAAGVGLKENVEVNRIVREVDITPTIAALLGTRLPAESEGSIIHQILSEEF